MGVKYFDLTQPSYKQAAFLPLAGEIRACPVRLTELYIFGLSDSLQGIGPESIPTDRFVREHAEGMGVKPIYQSGR